MPAKIIVRIDSLPEKAYWIEEEVLRIGCAPGCAIRIGHGRVPPHSATLEFIEGRYLIHNRNEHPLSLDDRTVPPRAASPWNSGESLALDDEVVLQLLIDGDPAPSSQPRPTVEEPIEYAEIPETPEEDLAEPPETGSGFGTLGQSFVILVCLVAIVGLLLYDPDKAAGPGFLGPSFGALIRDLTPERVQADPNLEAIRSALQEARIAERRGDLETEREAYLRIRDLLEKRGSLGPSPRADPAEPSEPRVEDQIWDYVRRRLSSRSIRSRPLV